MILNNDYEHIKWLALDYFFVILAFIIYLSGSIYSYAIANFIVLKSVIWSAYNLRAIYNDSSSNLSKN